MKPQRLKEIREQRELAVKALKKVEDDPSLILDKSLRIVDFKTFPRNIIWKALHDSEELVNEYIQLKRPLTIF